MDIWAARLPGARFLELFAGSGVVGCEALSRGAGNLVQVEGDLAVLKVLARNHRELELANVRLLAARLPDQLPRELAPEDNEFDLIFADPPYDFDAWDDLLREVSRYLVAEGAVALEHGIRRQLPGSVAGLSRVDLRRYGDSCLSFFAMERSLQG